jgi:halogenation protein CepH
MNTYDLIVIGGGPAGTTLATLVARAGHRVLLLEREAFPRYQIGESLLPATINGICELLGLREKVEARGYVLKRGATFSWGSDPRNYWTLNFGRTPADQMELAPGAPYAYNVPRLEFDRLLMVNAAEKGVDVRIGCRATASIEDNGRVCGVCYEDADGETREARARFVANASGQSGFSRNPVGEREYSEFFRKISVFGYYIDGGRLPRPLDGNVFFQAVDNTWIWYIPLSDRLTSVGAVLPADEAGPVKRDRRAALESYIAGCPQIADFLRDASPAAEPPFDSVRTRSEFSYCTTRFWSPGTFLVGDAACFVDVLLSSGVHLATYGALLAARSVNSVLGGRDETHCMNEYESRLRQEYAHFYQGLVGLYDMGRDGDTYTQWLRTLLRDTNGVFIEWKERGEDGARWSGGADAARALENLTQLRAYNAQQVRYAGPAAMTMERPVPALHHSLRASADGLSWDA